MIRVTVELIPRRGGAKRELARLDISNVSGPGAGAANYSIQGAYEHPNGDRTIIQTGLYGYERLRWNVLGLLYAALTAIGEESMRANPEKGLPE